MPQLSADERQLLHDSLQGYLSGHHRFEQWRSEAGNPDAADRRWAEYAGLGWLGVALPEEAGGTGGGFTELGIVMAAAGRHLVQAPLLGTLVLGAGCIESAGSAGQRAALLPRIAAGTLRLAFYHAEPDAGFARDFVETVAREEPDGFCLAGCKSFALGATEAGLLVVSARIGSPAGPVGLFLVDPAAPGLVLDPAPALDARPGAALRLHDVPVAADAVLGAAAEDRLAAIDQVLDRGALAVCAEACGAMAETCAATVAFLKVREQFGQPLARFQVLQHRMVDMNLASEEARAITHAALEALDGGLPGATRAIWQAKVQTARSARFVGAQGLQLHGGMGMTDELAIGHLYKRLAVCEAMFGDADWFLSQLAAAPPPSGDHLP